MISCAFEITQVYYFSFGGEKKKQKKLQAIAEIKHPNW